MDIYFNACFRGFNKVYKLLDQITDNTKFDLVEEELHDDLLALIHYVGDIYARLKDKKILNKLSKEEVECFLSFVYLNNQLKHDAALNVIYYEVAGSMYPMVYPMNYGDPEVYWAEFEDHGQSREAKREYYDLYLKNKEVRSTLEILEKIIYKKTEILVN